MAELPDLERLIAAAGADAASQDPLDQLAAAARIRQELEELAEALLDHFVQRARDDGRSWNQIGRALGVTKQAAQQRHTAVDSVFRRALTRLTAGRRGSGRLLFHRFTPRARESVVLAQQEARALNHNYVGTEHLLLGLLAQDDGVAARTLVSCGVDLASARLDVLDIIGRGETPGSGHIPFTPRAKKVLELALREAVRLRHDHIGPEHILLGLIREGDGVAIQVLRRRGVDLDRARDEVVRLLAAAA